MRILFLGNTAPGSSAAHRAGALARIGHEVIARDPLAALPASRLLNKLNRWTGFALSAGAIDRRLESQIAGLTCDLIWVDGGVWLGPAGFSRLRAVAPRVINYNLDDPTGRRDGNLWATFKRAIPRYDLMVAVRAESVTEYRALGARDVMQVYRGYDEVAHARFSDGCRVEKEWESSVVFAGTWMPERGPFMRSLLRAGLPLSIWGDRWEHAPEWNELKSCWRGAAVYGADYVRAIQNARIALGLLSKGNRDQHTQRSAEIPFIGTAFCAEFSGDHARMFRHGEQAMLWKSPDDCIQKCRELLGNEPLRRRMAAVGRSRVIDLELGNEPTVGRILERAFTGSTDPRGARDSLSPNQALV